MGAHPLSWRGGEASPPFLWETAWRGDVLGVVPAGESVCPHGSGALLLPAAEPKLPLPSSPMERQGRQGPAAEGHGPWWRDSSASELLLPCRSLPTSASLHVSNEKLNFPSHSLPFPNSGRGWKRSQGRGVSAFPGSRASLPLAPLQGGSTLPSAVVQAPALEAVPGKPCPCWVCAGAEPGAAPALVRSGWGAG